MSKKSKSIKIFICGIVSQFTILILGIIIPRLFIVNYGSEINGFLSSVRQIFVYVALLEAGIGTVSLQALYEPMAKNDYKNVSRIMVATDRYYKRTGVWYGIIVIIIALLYPYIFHTEISKTIIFGVIFFQGASGVINYFFQGKYTILLRVDGKSYVTTNILTIISVLTKIVQIILVISGYNIMIVQASYFAINLIQMLYITIYIKKNYSWIDYSQEPNYNALKQGKNVIVHQISGLIFNNTDILVLTYFCGLKTVSVYSLYNMIINCVSGIIDTICSSVEFVLGQAFHSNREYFLKLQEVYEVYYFALSYALFTITLIMLPAFIAIYARGITDANYVDVYLPYLFVILNLLMYSRRTCSQIINFAGHFKETQTRSIVESAINLTVSLILVRYIGVYGVLIGTIVALLYRTNDIILYVNRHILSRSVKNTYRRLLQNVLITVSCVILFKKILPDITSFMIWFKYSFLVSIFCFVIFFVVASLCDRESFKYIKILIKTKGE